MFSVIQRKAVDYFHKATVSTTTSPSLIEWFDLDYEEHIDMLALDTEITTFACLSNSHLMVVEVVTVLRDLSESRYKMISGYVGEPYNFNICWFP